MEGLFYTSFTPFGARYKYQCLIELKEQVEKQYNAMPDVFKNIYGYHEDGKCYQIRNPEEVKRALDEFWQTLRNNSTI